MAAIGQDSVTFLASFPPIQSAIKVGQDGMRIQLDVPESEMANAVRLITMREQVLEVSVRVSESLVYGKTSVDKRSTRSPLTVASG